MFLFVCCIFYIWDWWDVQLYIRLFFINLQLLAWRESSLTQAFFYSFQREVKSLASRFSDRPLKPMEEAIYWIEYVIRHNGAKFMKTAAVNMPSYQYYLLDVIFFLLVVLSTILFIAYRTILLIIRLQFLRNTKIKTNWARNLIISGIVYVNRALISNKS